MMYKKESCASGWSMAHAARAVFHTRIALLCAGMAFICTACDFFTPTWNEPIGAWFEKYTNEAAIDRHEFSSSYSGTDGFPCVSTERDCIVTFYMRNPQNYDLKPQYSFSGGSGSYVVFFNAPDKALMKERHRDVTHIIINGSRHKVEVEDDGETKFEGAAFTKVSVIDINDTSKYVPAQAMNTFTHISGRDIWCYNTGDASGSEVTFTLSLADKLVVAGSATSASTDTAKLDQPAIETKDAITDNVFDSTHVNLLAYDASSVGPRFKALLP